MKKFKFSCWMLIDIILIIVILFVLFSCKTSNYALDPNMGEVTERNGNIVAVKFPTIDGKSFAYDYFYTNNSDSVRVGDRAIIIFK